MYATRQRGRLQGKPSVDDVTVDNTKMSDRLLFVCTLAVIKRRNLLRS